MFSYVQLIYRRSAIRTILIFNLLLISWAHGVVWEDHNQWDEQWERKYQQWMASEKVYPNIFFATNSPYRGLKLDCADTAYALRGIFAFENSLPFAIHSPTGARTAENAYLTNRTSGFDHLRPEQKRFVAFFNYIGASVGTENLTRLDTFSPQIKSLRSGDLFTYKIIKNGGKAVRHTYVVKAINPQGTFHVIYSSQAIAHGNLPLIEKNHYQFTNLPHQPWGFRRFTWPALLDIPLSEYPTELAPGLEQYTMANQLGSRGFFRYVEQVLRIQEEMPESKFKRLLTSVCKEAQDRVDVVNLAVNYVQTVGGRCLNFEEYDTHSTPSRDQQLKEMFEVIAEEFRLLERAGNLNAISWQLRQWLEEIANKVIGEDNSLLAFCPINYAPGRMLSLSQIFSRLAKQQMSFHPNDRREVRWGDEGNRTHCRAWY